MTVEVRGSPPGAPDGSPSLDPPNGDVQISSRKLFTPTGEGGLTVAQVEEARREFGFNEVVNTPPNVWLDLLRRYLRPLPILMFIAMVLSASVPPRSWLSFGLLLVEINLVVLASWRSELKTNGSMQELKGAIAPVIFCLRDGEWAELKVRELVPGDVVLLKGGVVVPADCVLLGDAQHDGPVHVDESALTGESLALKKSPGAHALSGSVVKQGELRGQVTATGARTMFGKAMQLLGGEKSQTRLEKITRQMEHVLLAVGALVAFVLFLVQVFRPTTVANIGDAINVVLVVLISGAPTTLPLLIATMLAVGARAMAREKAVVTRLSAIEELAGMDILCSDKTGTLTLNQLQPDKPHLLPLSEAESTALPARGDIGVLAMLASQRDGAEPIDEAIFGMVHEDQRRAVMAEWEVRHFVPFNPVDKKTVATVVHRADRELVFHISKGSPDVINEMCHGSDHQTRHEVEERIFDYASRGLRTLGVAVRRVDASRLAEGGAAAANHSAPSGHALSWHMVGLLSLFDPPRHDTADVIKGLGELDVDVKMITGDQRAIAVETAARLGMGTSILGRDFWAAEGHTFELHSRVNDVNGFAGVYPEHKHEIVAVLEEQGHVVGMTGDGVNDAPALKRARVGIAVAGATEAAKGAADIILSRPGLSPITVAVRTARQTFMRMQHYLVYRLFAAGYIYGFLFLLLVALQFRLPTWSMVLLNVMMDFTVVSTSKDRVEISSSPMSWNLVRLCTVGFIMSMVYVTASVMFMYASLEQHWNWWPTMGVATPAHDQVVCAIWLHMTVSICTAILITRTNGFFFEPRRRPSLVVLFMSTMVPLCATFFAVYLPRTTIGEGTYAEGCGWTVAGVVWMYCVVVLVLADVIKIGVYYALDTEGSHTRILKRLRRQQVNDTRREALHEEGISTYLAQRRTSVQGAGDSYDDEAAHTCTVSAEEFHRRMSEMQQEFMVLHNQLTEAVKLFARGEIDAKSLEHLLG